MFIDADTLCPNAMGIATLISHFSNNANNLFQSRQEAIYTLIQISILMHVEKCLYLAIKFANFSRL